MLWSAKYFLVRDEQGLGVAEGLAAARIARIPGVGATGDDDAQAMTAQKSIGRGPKLNADFSRRQRLLRTQPDIAIADIG